MELWDCCEACWEGRGASSGDVGGDVFGVALEGV